MLKKLTYIINFSLFSFILFSCNKEENPQGKWLTGTKEEQINKIEEHFRGFGVAMMEIGYRYQELYFAVKDENWGYADHHLHEIEEGFELALEKKPERANSASYFVNTMLPEMKKFIDAKDTSNFDIIFADLTNACNSCHAMEKMPFITAKTPLQRLSPVRK